MGSLAREHCIYRHCHIQMDTETDNTDAALTTHMHTRTLALRKVEVSPLQVWYPFTLPTDPPTAGSPEPEQGTGDRREKGQDKQVRDTDTLAMSLCTWRRPDPFSGRLLPTPDTLQAKCDPGHEQVNTARDNIALHKMGRVSHQAEARGIFLSYSYVHGFSHSLS